MDRTASTTQNETAAAAMRHLRTVGKREVAAMRWLAAFHPDTLAALMTATAARSARMHSDVREHAGLIVAATYAGLTIRGGGEHGERAILHAAARAVRMADRAVMLADMWRAETAAGVGTGVLEYADGDSTRTTVPAAWGTHPADGIARMTLADTVDAAVGTVPLPMTRATLADTVQTYRRHAAGCQRCDADGPGRRVTLNGIRAHVAGHVDTDAAYWTAYRQTVRAVSMVDRDAALTAAPVAGGAVPLAVPAWTPVTREHPAAPLTRGGLTLPAVTVVRTVGVTRTVTDEGDRAGRRWQSAWDRLQVLTGAPRRGHGTVGEAVAAAAPGGMFGDAAAWLAADAAVREAWTAVTAAAVRMDRAPREVTRRTVTRTLPAMDRPGGVLSPVDTIRTADGDRPLTDGERDAAAAPAPVMAGSDAARRGETVGERRGDEARRSPLADADGGAMARTRDTRRDGGAGPRPRPRKGARGGQTGPTVPVRLTR